MKNLDLFKGSILASFFILLGYLAANHLSPTYPENVLIFLQQQWIYPLIPYIEMLFCLMMICTLITLWRNGRYASRALLSTIILYLFLLWLPDFKAEYPLQSLFVDLLSISLGILVGFLVIETNKFNLTNIQKLRIICLLFLISRFACQIVNPLADELLPRSFIEFVIADFHMGLSSYCLPLLSLCSFAIFVDPYTPQQRFLRYVNYKTMFVFLSICLFISPQRDVLTGWSSFVCESWSLLLGMMLILIWSTRQTKRIVSDADNLTLSKEMISTAE
jgi:uncharacterized membrane protein YccC